MVYFERESMRKNLAILLLGALCAVQGCAYGIYDDQRLIDTMTEDKALATNIKAKLLQAHFGDAFSVAVYCFYRHVFLVGEAPKNVRAKAIAIAKSLNPATVTPHWFSPERGDRNNFALAADLRAKLIATRGLSSTRIDTQVNAGRVVLLGVVADNAEKELAIQTARGVKGVVSVTSYLLTPPRPARHPD